MKLGYASASLGWMMITSSLRCTCCAKVEITEPYVYDAKTDAIFQDALAVHAGNNERLRKAGKPEKKPFQEVAALKCKKLAPPCLHHFYLTAGEKRTHAAVASALASAAAADEPPVEPPVERGREGGLVAGGTVSGAILSRGDVPCMVHDTSTVCVHCAVRLGDRGRSLRPLHVKVAYPELCCGVMMSVKVYHARGSAWGGARERE